MDNIAMGNTPPPVSRPNWSQKLTNVIQLIGLGSLALGKENNNKNTRQGLQADRDTYFKKADKAQRRKQEHELYKQTFTELDPRDKARLKEETRQMRRDEKHRIADWMENAASAGVSAEATEQVLRDGGDLQPGQHVIERGVSFPFVSRPELLLTNKKEETQVNSTSQQVSQSIDDNSSGPGGSFASISLPNNSNGKMGKGREIEGGGLCNPIFEVTANNQLVAGTEPAPRVIYRAKKPQSEASIFLFGLIASGCYIIFVGPLLDKGKNAFKNRLNPKTYTDETFNRGMNIVKEYNKGALKPHQARLFLQKCNMFNWEEVETLFKNSENLPDSSNKKEELLNGLVEGPSPFRGEEGKAS